MLKKSASFVLAALRGSTYRTELLGCRNYWRGFSVRQDSFKGRTAHTKCGTYLLTPSLAAALLGTRRVSARQGWRVRSLAFLSILRRRSPIVPGVQTIDALLYRYGFSAACYTMAVKMHGLGACPTVTVLLWRTIHSHLHRSRPEKILDVFQLGFKLLTQRGD